jgi:hypothetical protein
MLDWMASWPRWGWYVASVVFILLFALLFAGIYAAVNGPFVDPLLWFLAGGIPVALLRMWWFFWRRDRRKAKTSSAAHSPTT